LTRGCLCITVAVSSSSRWRRLPPEYGSTSEEEFGSSRNTAKHGVRSHVRPHHLVQHRGSRLSSTTSSGAPGVVPSPGGVGIKHRMKEQEEYIRDWTAHSEEIARISQDLAKDLAILAREIHDVAGEIDSVSSTGTAPSTTVSTAATTPGSAIDTREEKDPSSYPIQQAARDQRKACGAPTPSSRQPGATGLEEAHLEPRGVINVMVDPDGTLDALTSLGLSSPTTPTKPQTAKTTSPSATSPAKELLPEILPGPGGPAASTRVQSSTTSTEGSTRESIVGLGLTGVGGLPFSRRRPSGEEAIAQK
ncbi:hypothetical protein XENOCAPTIV_000231, partial [Xenoophorus captivus]